jgi:hypothetical protein
MSDYETQSFPEVAEALKDIREQYFAGADELVWHGMDRLHHSISATAMPPSWHFSKQGLADHLAEGRGFWDVYGMVAFQLGYHNCIVRVEERLS